MDNWGIALSRRSLRRGCGVLEQEMLVMDIINLNKFSEFTFTVSAAVTAIGGGASGSVACPESLVADSLVADHPSPRGGIDG